MPRARPLAVFCSPERYVQGPGATEDLGAQIIKVGLEGPILIVAGRAAERLCSDAWKRSLGAANLEYHVHSFGGECTAEEIDAVAETAKERGCKTIVGAGGGKAIDCARAAADRAHLRVVSCPTVASTDAPCSALSVVYDASGAFSEYLFYKRHPDLVLVDTQVIAQAPKRMLVGGLGDALATWFEARTVAEACSCNLFGGAPTATGTALAKLCYDILIADGPAAVAAVECRSCTPALERIVEANTLLSGLGFENGGLAVAHACHNGLTAVPATHSYTHGEKVAFGLATQLVLEGRPQTEIDTVMRYCDTVGLPITLTELGVDGNDEDAIRAVAERTIAPGETSHNEPFEVTARAVADAIRAAHWAGVKFQERKS
jgi:glycerol dehydrogenase